MSNPYLQFYKLQAGGNLAHFEGVRYQRGRGWFSKLGGKVMPALKYLGKNALAAATSFLGDVASGRDVKTALKRTALDAGSRVADDISAKIKKVQTGSGARKTRSRKATLLYKDPPLKLRKQKPRKVKRVVKKKTNRKRK